MFGDTKGNRSGAFGGGASNDLLCRKCGQPGHFARECQNAGTEGRRRWPNENFPPTDEATGTASASASREREPVTYIPTEAALDQLWGQHISPGENFDRFYSFTVHVSGDNTDGIPIQSFNGAGLPPRLLENVGKCGFGTPMPIQQYAIPYIAKGRDVMGCAHTGSGKTAAYLLPLISSILKRGDMSTVLCPMQQPSAIIVAPTRELAIQIKDEARKFAAGTMVEVAVAYGGTNVHAQAEKINRGCSILVATPGRLMQFVDESKVSLRKCRYLVLDEADRMLDMNFEGVIRTLLGNAEMPPKGNLRQTLMFSATFRKEIQQLVKDYLHQHVFITVGKLGSANEDVVQKFMLVPQSEKYDKLYELVTEDLKRAVNAGSPTATKTLVFVERRRVADFLASRMSQMGLPTTSIHGDRMQREREIALGQFKSGQCPILIATAVIARGLDIVGVDHVINLDLPSTIDDYVHRIGRTGRVGNQGRATSFYDPANDKGLANDLVRVLRDAHQIMPDFLLNDASAYGQPNAGGTADEGNGGGKEEEW